MNPPSRKQFKNRVLASLPKAEVDRLLPHLSQVKLKLRQQLMDGRTPYAYFPEEGLASIVLSMADGTTVEVGVVGTEGVVGLPVLLGAEAIPGETFMQVEGSGFRIDARFLKQEFDRPGELRRYLQKYVLANLVQSAQNAACNRLHPIAERLAKWILTCRDRIDTDRMAITHEFLGQMLGTPRTTVTLAAGMLHHAGLIDYSRGYVTIKNRAGLEKAVCECYGVVRKEFQKLGLL